MNIMKRYLFKTKSMGRKNYELSNLNDTADQPIYIAKPNFFRMGLYFNCFECTENSQRKIGTVRSKPFRFKARAIIQSKFTIQIEKEVSVKQQSYVFHNSFLKVRGDVAKLDYKIINKQNNNVLASVAPMKKKHQYEVKIFDSGQTQKIFLLLIGLETICNTAKY